MFFFFFNAGTPYVDPNARLVKLVELFQERAPWYIARKIFQRHRVPLGHGWENTVEQINISKHNADIDGLVAAFIEHISFGEKSVRMYDVGRVGMQNLRNQYTSFANPATIPLPLSGPSLQKAKPTDPKLVFVQKDALGLTALYSSVRKKEERERVDVSKLPLATRQALGDATEVITIKSKNVQSYDAVFLPSNGVTVEVRADNLSADNQESVTSAHQKIYADIHGKSLSKTLISPVDLFKAIKPIYDNASEGNVIELAFVTATGSTKYETMRDKQHCLRQEVYHVNGKAALGTDIEPYRLGVRWVLIDSDNEYFTPELYLEGRATMAAAKSPGLYSATIRKCRDAADYAVIRAKLQAYL